MRRHKKLKYKNELGFKLRFDGTNKLKIERYSSIYYTNGTAKSIVLIINQFKQNDKKVNILIPYLFCQDSLAIMNNGFADFFFYDLKENLAPDYRSINKNHQGVKIDIFLLVHYFGKVSFIEQKKARSYCSENSILLVEDCAHVISPLAADNWVGDFVLFSPHKFFNIPNLGIVFAKNPKNKFSSERGVFPFKWFVKNIIKFLIPFVLSKDRKDNYNVDRSSKLKSPSSLEINNINFLLNNVNFNCFEVFLKNLKELLSTKKDWSFLINEENILPHIFGMKCENQEVAKKRLVLLNMRYKIAMKWPDEELNIYENSLMGKSTDFRSKTIFLILNVDQDNSFYLGLIKEALANPNF